jgi:hypothetical protein
MPHDGTLIADTAQLLSRGQVARSEPAAGDRVKVKSNWTKFLAWLMRGDLAGLSRDRRANGTSTRGAASP